MQLESGVSEDESCKEVKVRARRVLKDEENDQELHSDKESLSFSSVGDAHDSDGSVQKKKQRKRKADINAEFPSKGKQKRIKAPEEEGQQRGSALQLKGGISKEESYEKRVSKDEKIDTKLDVESQAGNIPQNTRDVIGGVRPKKVVRKKTDTPKKQVECNLSEAATSGDEYATADTSLSSEDDDEAEVSSKKPAASCSTFEPKRMNIKGKGDYVNTKQKLKKAPMGRGQIQHAVNLDYKDESCEEMEGKKISKELLGEESNTVTKYTLSELSSSDDDKYSTADTTHSSEEDQTDKVFHGCKKPKLEASHSEYEPVKNESSRKGIGVELPFQTQIKTTGAGDGQQKTKIELQLDGDDSENESSKDRKDDEVDQQLIALQCNTEYQAGNKSQSTNYARLKKGASVERDTGQHGIAEPVQTLNAGCNTTVLALSSEDRSGRDIVKQSQASPSSVVQKQEMEWHVVAKPTSESKQKQSEAPGLGKQGVHCSVSEGETHKGMESSIFPIVDSETLPDKIYKPSNDKSRVQRSRNERRSEERHLAESSSSSSSASLSSSEYDKPKSSNYKTKSKTTRTLCMKMKPDKCGAKKGRGKVKKLPASSSDSSISDTSSCDDNGQTKPERLRKEDHKNLRSVFRGHFGKLCSAINDPLDLAAHLLEKGLISSSMMDKVLTTPYSRQEKCIHLVYAVDRRIKSNPDHLFIFIEVLMQDVVLQETGRAMWKKTGILCPVRTATKFGSETPPHEIQTRGTSSSNPGNKSVLKRREPDIAAEQCTSIGNVAESSNASSHLASHPASPVLLNYKRYLQSVYRARNLAPADKYLPSLKTKYINLTVKIKEGYRLKELPISMADLMSSMKGDEPVKFILVEGPPGIGKSTFAWEVCRKWDAIPKLRDYDVVVFIKLREKWVLNATLLPELFRYPADPDISKSIAKELNDSQGLNLVLVLDGFDEVSHNFHNESVLKSILHRKLLPECTIILTTRPSARSKLQKDFQPQVSKRVEIIGFTEEERVRYITEVFSKEPNLQVNFLKYMFQIPHIKSMMYIPLNCAIIAQVYHESQRNHHLAIPKTRTQLYRALTHSFLLRYMMGKDSSIDCGALTMPEGLPGDEMAKFKILAKFAFDSYHNKEMEVTFFEEEMPEGLVHFGFMNESTQLYASKGMERSYVFLHRSLQEYLAAWHLANGCSIECQVAYFALAERGALKSPLTCTLSASQHQEIMSYAGECNEAKALISKLLHVSPTLYEPAVFLAGITGFANHSRNKLWEVYLSGRNAMRSPFLLHSFFQAQNPSICRKYFVAKNDDSTLATLDFFGTSFGSFLTLYYYYALSYCVGQCTDNEFNMRLGFSMKQTIGPCVEMFIRGLSPCVEMFIRGLHDHCKSALLRVKRLTISVSKYVDMDDFKTSLLWLSGAPTGLVDLKEVVFTSTHVPTTSVLGDFLNPLPQQILNLKSLKIYFSKEDNPCREWEGDALMSLRNLRVLHLCNVECSPQQTDAICQLIENSLTEFTLDIGPSSTASKLYADSTLMKILNAVLNSKQINHLALPNVARSSMGTVHNILLRTRSLTTLELREASLGYDGILFLCSTLRNNTTLRELVIQDKETVPCVGNESEWTILLNQRGTELPPSTTTGTGLLLELNDILKANCTLEKIEILSGFFQKTSLYCIPPLCYDWSWRILAGLAPIQQFNARNIENGIPHRLRRSYSSSDLLQPLKKHLFRREVWWRSDHIRTACKNFIQANGEQKQSYKVEIYNPANATLWGAVFKQIFSMRRKNPKKFCSIPSFTAPDTELLQPFSHLDPRLIECLGLQWRDIRAEILKSVNDSHFTLYL